MQKNRNGLLVTLVLLAIVLLALCSSAGAGVRAGSTSVQSSTRVIGALGGAVENGEPDIGQTGLPKSGQQTSPQPTRDLLSRTTEWLRLASRIWVARYLGIGF
jgi:hypothetical protein